MEVLPPKMSGPLDLFDLAELQLCLDRASLDRERESSCLLISV